MDEIRKKLIQIFGLVIMAFAAVLYIVAAVNALRGKERSRFLSRMSEFLIVYGNIWYRGDDICKIKKF